ncbi:hypothetical protein LLG96_17240 [bacterium]|nr:hypothetical protein [bacterium]
MKFRTYRALVLTSVLILVSGIYTLSGHISHPGIAPQKMITTVLSKAGCPLSEAQIEQIRNIKPGPEAREQISAILNDAQKKALKAARARFSKAHRPGMVAQILEQAGYPLAGEPAIQLQNEYHEAFRKQVQTEEYHKSISILEQYYPYPFICSTKTQYYLAKPGTVMVETISPNGQPNSTLVNEYQNTGTHSVVWDGSSYTGGVYLCSITSGDVTEPCKITLVKQVVPAEKRERGSAFPFYIC